MDLYLDQTLKTPSEWRNTEEVVRNCFKSLFESVKAQGASIRDLEKQISSKVSRIELSSKADQLEVSQSFAEIDAKLEQRSSLELQAIIDDKVSRGELSYLLNSRVSTDQFSRHLESKVDKHDWKENYAALHSKLDLIQKEVNKKVATLEHDLSNFLDTISLKPDLTDVEDILDNYVSKQTFSNSIQKKISKEELQQALATKTNSSDLNTAIADLKSTLDSSLSKIHRDLDSKSNLKDLKRLEDSFKSKVDSEELASFTRNFEDFKDKTENNKMQLDATIFGIRNEIDHLRKNTTSSIAKKFDSKDIDKIYASINKKVDSEGLSKTLDLYREESKHLFKSLQEELKDQKAKSSSHIELSEKLQSDVSIIQEQLIAVIKSKLNQHDASEDLAKDMQFVRESLEKHELDIEELSKNFYEEREAHDDSIHNLIDSKMDIAEVHKLLNNFHNETNSMVKSALPSEDTLLRLSKEIESKISFKELYTVLQDKVDKSELYTALLSKASASETELIKSELYEKASLSGLEDHINSTKRALEAISHDMNQKANTKEICAILDSKANIDDVNSIFSGIHLELDTKLSSNDYSAGLLDQQVILEALCLENCVGRWMWKSGELRNGLVPWEIQTVNTASDNFIWERHRNYICVNAPGHYELKLGIFARKKPVVQIMVNGEPLNISQNSHQKKGITGLSVTEFVVLPVKARVSLYYMGEKSAEGFLSLKKL